jgi:hypothetical protein
LGGDTTPEYDLWEARKKGEEIECLKDRRLIASPREGIAAGYTILASFEEPL